MSEWRPPKEQLLQILPPDKQIISPVECTVLALYVLGGHATECEMQLAAYVLHRLGICDLSGYDWKYKPCVWWKEDKCEIIHCEYPILGGEDDTLEEEEGA